MAAVNNIPYSFGQIFVWTDRGIQQETNRNCHEYYRFNGCGGVKRYNLLWQKRIKYEK